MGLCKSLMTMQNIAAYNRANAALEETGVVLLEQAETVLDRARVCARQELLPYPKEPRFDGCGHFIPVDFYRALEQQMNWQKAPAVLAAEYGIMSDQGLLRTFPTDCPSYRERWSADLDRFSVTLLRLGEPVLIWRHSRDDAWLFVQNRHTWGWVERAHVALCAEAQWRSWVEEREFVQSLSSREIISYYSGGQEWQQVILMGTKLPSYGQSDHQHIVLLPRRNQAGWLQVEQILLPADERFSAGYLPFKQCYLVEQGLKMLGEAYGWGGANGFRDCTSLVDDVFGLFGFQLARNSSAQRRMAGVHPIMCTDERGREELISTLPVGTVLYLPGHAMIYLGERPGRQDILHSVYQMGLPMGDDLVVYKARQVMRGYLRQYRADGSTFLQSLTEYWCPWQI